MSIVSAVLTDDARDAVHERTPVSKPRLLEQCHRHHRTESDVAAPGARPQTGFEGAGLNRSAPEPRDQPRSETLRPIPAGVLRTKSRRQAPLVQRGEAF